MESLKDNYTIIKWDGVNQEKVWFEEDVKKAVLDFENLLDICIKISELLKQEDNEIHNQIIEGYKAILKHHKKIFGDWEE